MERKSRRLSSEMLKRKRTKGSRSQAPIPEGKPEREAPVERLWERSREGRKETNRELSMQNRKDFMGNQGGRKGEPEKRKRKRRYLRSHRKARRGKSEKEERKAE